MQIVPMHLMKWGVPDRTAPLILSFGTPNESSLIALTQRHAFILTGFVMGKMTVGIIAMSWIVQRNLQQIKIIVTGSLPQLLKATQLVREVRFSATTDFAFLQHGDVIEKMTVEITLS